MQPQVLLELDWKCLPLEICVLMLPSIEGCHQRVEWWNCLLSALFLCGQTHGSKQTAGGRAAGSGLQEGVGRTLGGPDCRDHSVVGLSTTPQVLQLGEAHASSPGCEEGASPLGTKGVDGRQPCSYLPEGGACSPSAQGQRREGRPWLPAGSGFEDGGGAGESEELQPRLQNSGGCCGRTCAFVVSPLLGRGATSESFVGASLGGCRVQLQNAASGQLSESHGSEAAAVRGLLPSACSPG